MAQLALVIAVVAVSTSAPLVRAAAPASALTVASLRVCIAALLLLAIANKSLRVLAGLPRRHKLFIVAAGLLLGAHFGVWIASLYLTSTAASVALVATQPVFAAVLGAAFLGDRVDARAVAGIAIAAVGCLVLGHGDLGRGSDALWGDVLALLGAAFAAGYLVVGRGLRESLPLPPYLAAVNCVAGAVLLVAALIAGVQFTGFSTGVYGAIVTNAIVGSIVGHTLLNWTVRRVPAHLVTLAILGEPVGASILTWIFFAEQPPVAAVVGGAIILAGIAVGFARKRPG